MINMTGLTPIFLLLILFTGGCRPVGTGAITNVRGEPIPTPSKEKIFLDDSGRLINTEGWTIPMPRNKKPDGHRVIDGKTAEGGKVQVAIFYYLPTEPFLYDQNIDSAFKDRFLSGRFKLESIGEVTSNRKTYGYLVNARPSSRQGPGFTSRYYDSDGDGKFETLIGNSTPFPIPEWTLR